jgi:protein-S-isoprenylcysteine O-methyltransferase Ste14
LINNLWNWLIWAWCGFEILVALVTHTRKSGGKVQDRGSMFLLWIAIFTSITASELIRALVPAARLHNVDWLSPFLLAVLLAGIVIRLTAIVTLGKSFSVNVAIRTEQTMQKTGLYRIVRHPSYLGLLIIFFAIGLQTRNWASLIAVLIPTTLALLYRIHVEEDALLAHFGEDYAAYCRETKRLIPGVY